MRNLGGGPGGKKEKKMVGGRKLGQYCEVYGNSKKKKKKKKFRIWAGDHANLQGVERPKKQTSKRSKE